MADYTSKPEAKSPLPTKAVLPVKAPDVPPIAVLVQWKVWLLTAGAGKNPLIVAATDKAEAWSKFCKVNNVSETIRGGRVIRPALESELPKKA